MAESDRSIQMPAATRRKGLTSFAGLMVLVVVLALPVHAATGFSSIAGPSHAAPMATVATTHTAAPTLAALPPMLRSSVISHINSGLSGLASDPLASRSGAALRFPADHGALGARPAPAGGSSTNSNFYVSGSDCSGWGKSLFVPFIGGENLAQVGSNSQDLLAAGGTMSPLFNVVGGVNCSSGAVSPLFLSHGLAAVYSSSDGGVTWTQQFLPRNVTHWQVNGDPTNQSISTGSVVVAAAPNGKASAIFGYGPACVVVGETVVNCTGPAGVQAPWGFAISTSTDSGATWSNATQLNQETAIKWTPFAPSCAAFGLSPGYYVTNLPERDWIVSDGTNLVAGWDVFHQNWDTTNCTRASQAFVQISSSSNGGASWGAPINISNSVSDSVSLVMGPASTHTTYAVFANFANASATTGQYAWATEKSTNGGVTWTTESDIGPAFVNPSSPSTTSPDNVAWAQFPVLAADNWTGSPHSGNLYLVWQDNQTGTYAGYSGIAYTRSTDGMTSWSSITTLTAGTTSLVYILPSVAVGPDGTVWVTYYGFNTQTGDYNVYGVYSTDGGSTWSRQFLVTDTPSAPGTVVDIGFYMGSVATTGKASVLWSDCRSPTCGSNGDVMLYAAQVGAFNVTTNAPAAVTMQTTVFGATSSYATPITLGIDSGATVTVQAPPNVPYNATHIDSFTSWAGASVSGNYRTTFTYGGSGNLTALYTPVPAAFFAGNVSPIVAGVSLQVDGTPVTLTPVNATTSSYNIAVASGTAYYLNASAPNYVPIHRLVAAAGGVTTYVNFNLQKVNGTITGTLDPVTANLTLNGVSIAASVNVTTKIFTLVVPWGSYWVNASLQGYTSATAFLTVPAGGVATHNFLLTGGWISGSVHGAIASLVVTVDGGLVPTLVGTFNASVAGGFHTLCATQRGFNLSCVSNIAVVPGQTHLVNVTLTDHGWITGTIGPVGALGTLLLSVTNGTQGGPQQYNTATGAFNISVTGGKNWSIRVQSTGYDTTKAVVYVSPGNVTPFSTDLNKTPSGGCTVNCGGNNTNNGSGNGGGIPLTTILIIVVVIVVVAAIAMVLLMRRRGGGDGGGGGGGEYNETPPDQQTYEASDASNMPKLQSDGSMGGSPP